MSDRRAAPRRRAYLGAQVLFNNRLSVFDCLIRNLADGGALLEFAHPATVPDGFELMAKRFGESRRTEVRWRTEFAVGVQFAEQARAPYVSMEATRKIRRLEAERDALRARVAELS